ncbi:MAG: hypothetical protein WAM42_00420 [Candidatus Nitrosopolaris sp.]
MDLKAKDNKIGLKEFYAQKNHRITTRRPLFLPITYRNLTKKQKSGEILSCYEEVDEKRRSPALVGLNRALRDFDSSHYLGRKLCKV